MYLDAINTKNTGFMIEVMLTGRYIKVTGRYSIKVKHQLF